MECIQILDKNSSEELRQLIYKLRYEVLVVEQGKTPEHANHKTRTVKEPLDKDGLHFLKIKHGKVIGAIRLNHLRDITDAFSQKTLNFDFFEKQNLQDEVTVLSRIV